MHFSNWLSQVQRTLVAACGFSAGLLNWQLRTAFSSCPSFWYTCNWNIVERTIKFIIVLPIQIFYICSLIKYFSNFITGYKRVRQFSLPAETVGHIWLLPRLSTISCFLPWLLCLVNSFLQRLSVWFCFLLRVSAGSRITRTVSAGRHFSWTVVSAGSRRSRTVSAEAKYDGQSLQEAKISGLFYTLCL